MSILDLSLRDFLEAVCEIYQTFCTVIFTGWWFGLIIKWLIE